MDPQILQFMMSLLALCVWIGMFVFTLVLGFIHIGQLKKHWKTGLVLGLVCVGLMVPLLIFRLAHFDVEAAVGQMSNGDMPNARLILYIGMGAGIIINALRIPWYGFVYHTAVSEWNLINQHAFPVLDKKRAGIGDAFLPLLIVGIVLGVVSVWVFWLLQIEMSGPLKRMLRSFPGTLEAPVAVRMALTVPAAIMPAVVEELAFRGVLMGFMKRVFGESRATLVVAIIITAALWGILHLPNTSSPSVKFAQIFLVGLLLGWIARNGKVEKAIIVHAGLNVVAAVFGVILAG